MSKNIELVTINLDRPRILRFGHLALKTLKAITGKTLTQVQDTLANLDPDEIELFMYCGLLSDAKSNGEQLTIERVSELLDGAENYMVIIEKMSTAIARSFGADGDDLKNMKAIEKQ